LGNEYHQAVYVERLSDEELQHGWLANKALILRKIFARIKKVVVVRPRFTNWLMLYAA